MGDIVSRMRRTLTIAVGTAGVGALALTGCSSNSNSNPSTSPTTSPTSATASPTPTASPTATSGVSKYTVRTGSFALVKGLDTGRWPALGGSMVITPSGSGVLSGTVAVAAKGNATKGDWILNLKSDSKGNVESGSLTSPGISYKVTGPGGKINYLTTEVGTTLITVTPIPVQNGTEAPTTMTLSIVGAK